MHALNQAARAAPVSRDAASGPYTGTEYLSSLDDGREIWIYGERVKTVTEHPAFRNGARMIARLYDALHDPATRDLMTVEMDDGSGMRTQRFFQAPRSAQEQVAARDAIAHWARMTYGWIGRTPDYKAAFLVAMAVNKGLCGEYQPNVDRWYDYARRRVPYINHAIVNPPIDRNLPPESSDVNIRVEKETHAGLVVSGAKVVATGAALTHYTFIGHSYVSNTEKRLTPVFMVPMNAPGLKIICRGSYEYVSGATGSPFDNPLSSRLDENDAIIVFDKVLIPWEDVLMYGLESSNKFMSQRGFLTRALMHGCTRLAVKFDFICGLFLKAVEITGTKDFRGVQAAVGESMGLRQALWGLSNGMAYAAEPWNGDYVLPNSDAAHGYRTIASDAYSRLRSQVGKVIASSLVYLPSTARDFENPALRPYLDKYVRGSNGVDSVERVKTLKLLWDAIGSEFASRHDLYEMNYSGSYEKSKLDPLMISNGNGCSERMKAFAQTCMDEYDLKGWTAPDLVNPDDFNIFTRR
jgi:4-hydroxyphenylacetate 3-monooxygenase